jgi:hypothetical protein
MIRMNAGTGLSVLNQSCLPAGEKLAAPDV